MKYTFGKKLKDIARQRKISIRRLATETNIPLDTIYSLTSRGARTPLVTTLIVLSKYLDMTIDELIKGVEF